MLDPPKFSFLSGRMIGKIQGSGSSGYEGLRDNICTKELKSEMM